jgi:hypothetical protein
MTFVKGVAKGHTGRAIRDLTGQVFGRLTARWPAARYQGSVRWLCSCSCGGYSVVVGSNLSNGDTQSCGCAIRERVTQMCKERMTHGASDTGTYSSYSGAKGRCNNVKDTVHYPDYGGRGIEFKFKSFQEFVEHIGPRPDGMSLDRINNDGNYEVGNVRWANAETQRANQRRPKKYRPRKKKEIPVPNPNIQESE